MIFLSTKKNLNKIMNSTNSLKSRHTLSYCNICEEVVCADCCNGGTNMFNDKKCGCLEAYERYKALMYIPYNIEFANDKR